MLQTSLSDDNNDKECAKSVLKIKDAHFIKTGHSGYKLLDMTIKMDKTSKQ